MIKYLFLCLFIACAGCAKQSPENTELTNGGGFMKDFYISGMHYREFENFDTGTFIINITKDSLEVEYYKKQLKP